MKNSLKLFTFSLLLLGITTASFAQTTKVITLNDGSTLKGKVLQLIDGVYTIETTNLGNLTIKESDVLSISSLEGPPVQSSGTTNIQKAQIESQVQKLQGSILSDPSLLMDFQNLMSDQEIQSMLSDPTLLNDVMSYDPEKIKQNSTVQDLLNNKKMQELMEKIQQQIPAEE